MGIPQRFINSTPGLLWTPSSVLLPGRPGGSYVWGSRPRPEIKQQNTNFPPKTQGIIYILSRFAALFFFFLLWMQNLIHIFLQTFPNPPTQTHSGGEIYNWCPAHIYRCFERISHGRLLPWWRRIVLKNESVFVSLVAEVALRAGPFREVGAHSIQQVLGEDFVLFFRKCSPVHLQCLS